MPQGAFQHALYWVLPVLQPLATLLVSALGIFAIALTGVATLRFLPYVAPLLLLPALWLGLLALSLMMSALCKWLLLGRAQPTSYAKYSWAFQSKAINASIVVRAQLLPSSPLLICHHVQLGMQGAVCLKSDLPCAACAVSS